MLLAGLPVASLKWVTYSYSKHSKSSPASSPYSFKSSFSFGLWKKGMSLAKAYKTGTSIPSVGRVVITDIKW